ncbi:uncharacterized protein [Antedon mediterranea]|uniref:uncharacterized protein isoform X2 n=1 Tax=Antedon mediterranea TaxID=105859 RepID=UPI003AF41255
MATDINLDLMEISKWYDDRGLLRQLKVLYGDLIAVANIDKAHTTLDLLNELRNKELLSSDNTLLYETIKVTQQFGVIKRLKQCLPVKEVKITKFTRYRLNIVEFGNGLTQEDVARIDGLYNTPVKNYKDAWSMIMDLEHRQILCVCKMEEFIKNLRKLGLELAVTLLTKGEKKEEDLLQKQKNSQASRPTRYKVDTSQMVTHMEQRKSAASNISNAIDIAIPDLDKISGYYYENEAMIAWWNDWKARDQRARIEKTYIHGRFSRERRTLFFPNGRWYCCFTQQEWIQQ